MEGGGIFTALACKLKISKRESLFEILLWMKQIPFKIRYIL